LDRAEFTKIRIHLGKTQRQMAQLLGTSIKAVQSFEQGWRNIPVHIERQVLFLLAKKASANGNAKACWKIRKCSSEKKDACPAFEFQVGDLCWFINGTVCHGKVFDSWPEKMEACRSCPVFQSAFPDDLISS
jgi:DNA-binding XRE family transcriptional regulator